MPKMLANLDLNKNEIQNAVLHPLSSPPLNPVEGQIYYNNVDKLIYQWDGTQWLGENIAILNSAIENNGIGYIKDTENVVLPETTMDYFWSGQSRNLKFQIPIKEGKLYKITINNEIFTMTATEDYSFPCFHIPHPNYGNLWIVGNEESYNNHPPYGFYTGWIIRHYNNSIITEELESITLEIELLNDTETVYSQINKELLPYGNVLTEAVEYNGLGTINSYDTIVDETISEWFYDDDELCYYCELTCLNGFSSSNVPIIIEYNNNIIKLVNSNDVSNLDTWGYYYDSALSPLACTVSLLSSRPSSGTSIYFSIYLPTEIQDVSDIIGNFPIKIRVGTDINKISSIFIPPVEWANINNRPALYYSGYCSTNSTTSEKSISLDQSYDTNLLYRTGFALAIRFYYACGNVVPSLKVNGTTKSVYIRHGQISTSAPYNCWLAGEVKYFVYDGTYWILLNPTLTGATDTALMGNGVTDYPKFVSVAPNITITDGTSNAAPQINVTALGVSGTAKSITMANTGVYGVTKLDDTVTSTSTALAATPNAVKTAYDLADSKQNAIGTAAIGSTTQPIYWNGSTFVNASQVFYAEYNVTPYSAIVGAMNANQAIFVKNVGSNTTTYIPLTSYYFEGNEIYFTINNWGYRVNASGWTSGPASSQVSSLNSASKLYLVGAQYHNSAISYTNAHSNVYMENGTLTATAFNGNGASLTALNASNVATGILPIANGGTGANTAENAMKNLVGSNAIGTNSVPVYWNGSALVPDDYDFVDFITHDEASANYVAVNVAANGVMAVKGAAEGAYRTGSVSINAENILGSIAIGSNSSPVYWNGSSFVNTSINITDMLGSTPIGSESQPVYWNGSSFVNSNITAADIIGSTQIGASNQPVYWNGSSFIESDRTDTVPRPNLLKNWYFVGGGSQQGGGQFPINTQGQTSYNTLGTCIDKWTLSGSHTLSLQSDGLKFVINSGASVNQLMRQYVPDVNTNYKYTISILVTENTTTAGVKLRYGDNQQSGEFTGTGVFSYTITPWNTGDGNFSIMASNKSTDNGKYIVVAAMKVELGDTQTLAHQENGVWVLNEIPSYNTEALKCNLLTPKRELTAITSGKGDLGSGVSPRYIPYLWYNSLGHNPVDGEMILIKTPGAGNTAGVYLSINGDTTANYHPIVASNTTGRLTTHFSAGVSLLLIYEANMTADVYPIAGADARSTVTGIWRVINYYDSNTNTLLRTYKATNSIDLPLLLRNSTGSQTAANAAISTYADSYGAIANVNVPSVNPSTGQLTVPYRINANSFGADSIASGTNALAIGSAANATGTVALAVGRNAHATDYAVSIGFSSNATAYNSIAIGVASCAAYNYSYAIGHNARTTRVNSIMFGDSGIGYVMWKGGTNLHTSDVRDKTDIEEIPNGATEFLDKLTPIKYRNNFRDQYQEPEEWTEVEKNDIIEEDENEEYPQRVCNLSAEEREKREKYFLGTYDKEAWAEGTKKSDIVKLGVTAQDVLQALEDVYGDSKLFPLVYDALEDYTDEELPEDVERQYSLDYIQLIPFLIKSIQEMDARIKVLEEKLNE